jgi:hypothetical protein
LYAYLISVTQLILYRCCRSQWPYCLKSTGVSAWLTLWLPVIALPRQAYLRACFTTYSYLTHSYTVLYKFWVSVMNFLNANNLLKHQTPKKKSQAWTYNANAREVSLDKIIFWEYRIQHTCIASFCDNSSKQQYYSVY